MLYQLQLYSNDLLFFCVYVCVCVLDVTQVETVNVSAQRLLPTLKSVTAEESTSVGGPRSSVVRRACNTPSRTSLKQMHLKSCVFVFTFVCCLFFPIILFCSALQCENGLVYNPCGPACSTSCPSVQQSPHSQCDALSCVEGCFCPAGTVRHGK